MTRENNLQLTDDPQRASRGRNVDAGHTQQTLDILHVNDVVLGRELQCECKRTQPFSNSRTV